MGNAVQGASLGAGIGTAIAPGVGTLVGAGAGYLAGGAYDWFSGKKKKEQEAVAAQRAAAERQQAMGYYQPAAQNAAGLYQDAVQRSNTSYQTGGIRDVDLSQGNALQGRQMGGLDMQQGQINGPSTAGAQYAAAMGQQRNAAMGMVAQSRGAGRGAGRLNVAGQMGANAGINAQQQAAAVGMERQNAINSYTQAIQGARGQDMDQAGMQAGMQIQRDQAQDAAARGAFDSTHNAQQGYLNTATNALGQQAGIAGNQANTTTGQAANAYTQQIAANAEEERRRRQGAGDLQSLVDTGAAAYTNYNQGRQQPVVVK